MGHHEDEIILKGEQIETMTSQVPCLRNVP